MAYTYDRRTAREYGSLSQDFRALQGQLKKTKEQLGSLRVTATAYARTASHWEHPRYNPEEGEEQIPEEADPYFVKVVENVIAKANALDKAIYEAEHWEPPH